MRRLIILRRQVPVFVGYCIVRADDRGRANFLFDIYGHDADAVVIATRPDTKV